MAPRDRGHAGRAEVTQVRSVGGVNDSDDRVDRERARLADWRAEHPNNDGEQDGS